MFPVLFTLPLGGREIAFHSYGVFIAVGMALGIVVAHRRATALGMSGARVLDLSFWMIVAGFVGARVVYGLVNARTFARACLEGGGAPRTLGAWLSDCSLFFKVWQGGLVFYGGLAGAALVAVRFARREGWTFGRIGDVFAPGLALGHAVGRFGCFAAGCCFGKEGAGRLGVSFPKGSVAFEDLAAASVVRPGDAFTPSLHPAQLYEAAGDLAIFGALLALAPRLRARPGALFLLYLAFYAALRFVVEIFRGDVGRRYLVSLDTPRLAEWLHLPPAEPLFLSMGQLGSLLLAALLAIAVLRRRRASASA